MPAELPAQTRRARGVLVVIISDETPGFAAESTLRRSAQAAQGSDDDCQRGTCFRRAHQPVFCRGRVSCHPDFTQELPRKLLPTRAKESQRRRREKRYSRGVVCGALAPVANRKGLITHCTGVPRDRKDRIKSRCYDDHWVFSPMAANRFAPWSLTKRPLLSKKDVLVDAVAADGYRRGAR